MRFRPSYHNPLHRVRRKGGAGFSLMEMLAVLAVIGLVSYSSMSLFKMVQPAARGAALQELTAALDEARTNALRKGAPSPFFLRRQPNEFGQEAIREFGVERQSGDGTILLWRKLPPNIVLSDISISKMGGQGMNLASLTMKSLAQFEIPGLMEEGSQRVGGLVFGQDGEVVYPSQTDRGAAEVLTLVVAHEMEDMRDESLKRHVRIEIRPGTGHAYILE